MKNRPSASVDREEGREERGGEGRGGEGEGWRWRSRGGRSD